MDDTQRFEFLHRRIGEEARAAGSFRSSLVAIAERLRQVTNRMSLYRAALVNAVDKQECPHDQAFDSLAYEHAIYEAELRSLIEGIGEELTSATNGRNDR